MARRRRSKKRLSKGAMKKRLALCKRREKKNYNEAIRDGMPRSEAKDEYKYQVMQCLRGR